MVDDTRTEWQTGGGCGSGSTLPATVDFRKWLKNLPKRYPIRTIADVGCGRQQWQSRIGWPKNHIRRDGYDIRYTPKSFNAITDILPKPYDLIMCLYVTNHFTSSEYIRRTIQNFKGSGSTFLLLTYAEGPPDREPWDCPIAAEPLEKYLAHENENWDWYHGLWRLSDVVVKNK